MAFVASDLSSDTLNHKIKYLEVSAGVCILPSIGSVCTAIPVFPSYRNAVLPGT